MRISGIGYRHALAVGLIGLAVGCGAADRSDERMSAGPPVESSVPPEWEEVALGDSVPPTSDVPNEALPKSDVLDLAPPPLADVPDVAASPTQPRSLGPASPGKWNQAITGSNPRPRGHSTQPTPPRAVLPESVAPAMVLGAPDDDTDIGSLESLEPPPYSFDASSFRSFSMGAGAAPSAAPTSEQPASTSTEIVDAIKRRLHQGNIVYNAPPTMQYGEPKEIELLISPSQSVAELKPLLRDATNVASAAAQIGNRMEAQLTGTGFAIEALSPPLQAVSGTEPTQWRWRVTPTSYGLQELHLSLLAPIDIDGKETPLVVETTDARIEVNITVGQQIAGFVGSNWQWLWATVVLPVLGLRHRRRKRSDDYEPRRAAA